MMKLPCLAAAFLVAATVSAQSLTGRVVDPNGVGIHLATVILDRDAAPVDTDVNGNFTIASANMRNGRVYTVSVDPHNDFIAPREFDVTVNGVTNLGNVTTQPGVPISCTLVGPTGSPLLGANLSAFLPDGTKLFTPHDGSDAFGNAKVTLPLTTVNLRIAPPVGTTLVPFYQPFTPTLGNAIQLGTVTLRQGYSITGSVVRTGATPFPVVNAELIATNALTGETVYQANRRTNTLGSFNLLLPFGLYDLEIRPAVGSPYAARIVYGVFVIDFPRNLGLLACDLGVSLSGTVVGPTGPIVGADIDVLDALGHKLFTPNDNTSATGFFSVIVPTGGTYTVQVDPPVAYNVIGTKSNPVVVNAAASVGVLSLQTGYAAAVTVVDQFGAPIPGAIAKVRNSVTSTNYVIPGNVADAQGVIHTVLPASTVDITLSAPQGTTHAPFHIGPVPIIGPFSVTLPLASKTIWTNLSALSVLTIPNGGSLQMAWTIGNTTTQLLPFTLEAVVPLESGVEVPWIPAIPLDFPGPFALTLFVDVPMPPLAPAEMNHVQKFLIRLRNPATQEILDEAYVRYVPQ